MVIRWNTASMVQYYRINRRWGEQRLLIFDSIVCSAMDSAAARISSLIQWPVSSLQSCNFVVMMPRLQRNVRSPSASEPVRGYHPCPCSW